MDRQLVERIILEELETLSELGKLDEGILDKIKDSFSRAFMSKDQKFISDFEKKNPQLKVDDENDLRAAMDAAKELGGGTEGMEKYLSMKRAELGAAATMKKLEDDLPDGVAHGNNPLPFNTANLPVLLDPIAMFGTYGFVWDYSNASNGDKPRKYKPGARSGAGGARLFYRQMCRNGLAMYCPNRWFRMRGTPDPAPETTPMVEPETEVEPTGGGPGLPVPVFKKFTGKERDQLGMDKSSAGSLSSQLQKLFPNVPKAVITQMLKDVAGQLKTNGVAIQEAKLIIAEELYKHLSVLNEVRYDKDNQAEQVAALVKQFDVQPGNVKKIKKAKGIAGKPSFIAVNKQGVGRIYSVDSKPGAEGASGGKEQAEQWAQSGEQEQGQGQGQQQAGNDLFNKFKATMKRLDLHTQAGRKAALNNDQSYLGAFRFYKAMLAAFKAIKKNDLEGNTNRLLKMVEPLNEEERPYGARYGESEQAGGKDFRTWLANTINIFKENGLTDSKRAMKAMKAARQGITGKPKDITRPRGNETPQDVVKRVAAAVKGGKATKADLDRAREAAKAAGAETSRRTGAKGAVNTKQVVGSRLKQGGININSPEGKKLQNRIQKVIRRFLRKNLKRVGKDVNLIAEQRIEKKIVEHVTRYILERNLTHKGES